MGTLIYFQTGANTGPINMSWPQPLADNPFLVFSMLCASAAVVVLIYDVVRSRRSSASQIAEGAGEGDNESPAKKRGRSLLDTITLLNKNLIQCPRCFRIEFSSARFCSKCGAKIISSSELV